MDKARVFVSFKPADQKYMDMLLEWNTGDYFELAYETARFRVPFHSPEGAVLKEELKAKIKSGTHLLVIVGKDTGNNDWINWEIQTASVTGKCVVAVKLDKNCKAPAAALNFGAAWADTFAFEPIRHIIDMRVGGPDEIVQGAVMGGMMEG